MSCTTAVRKQQAASNKQQAAGSRQQATQAALHLPLAVAGAPQDELQQQNVTRVSVAVVQERHLTRVLVTVVQQPTRHVCW